MGELIFVRSNDLVFSALDSQSLDPGSMLWTEVCLSHLAHWASSIFSCSGGCLWMYIICAATHRNTTATLGHLSQSTSRVDGVRCVGTHALKAVCVFS